MPIISDSQEYRSKSELFRDLRVAGYDPKDDHLDELRPELLTPFVSLPGKGNERFATVDQANRVWLYYLLRRRNQLTKPRKSEIAFWFAACGFQVPPELVAEHIEDRVDSFVALMYRFIRTRAGGVVAMYGTTPRDAAMDLGRLIAKAVVKRMGLGSNPITQQAIGWFIGLGLCSMLRGDPYPAVAGRVSRFLELLGVSDATKHARGFWTDATEVASFFVQEQENSLIRAVREANAEDPAIVAQAASDALRLARLGSHAFPWFLDARSLQSTFPAITDYDVKIMDRGLVPMFAAALLHLRNNEYTKGYVQRLRVDDPAIVQELSLAREVMPEIAKRIGVA